MFFERLPQNFMFEDLAKRMFACLCD